MGRCYVLVGLLLVACYEPAPVDCAYACGAGDACPDGTTCEGGFCRTPDATGDCPGDLCGNHRMDAGEECDDNDDNTDGCAACRIATCGDGYVHAGDEQCDDANANIDDGCVA